MCKVLLLCASRVLGGYCCYACYYEPRHFHSPTITLSVLKTLRIEDIYTVSPLFPLDPNMDTKQVEAESGIVFDKVEKRITLNGKYAGYCDGSSTLSYGAEIEGDEVVIRVVERVKIDPPIVKDNGDSIAGIDCPIIILRLPKSVVVKG